MEQIEKAMARARESRASNLKQLRPANAAGHRVSVDGVAPIYTETAVTGQDLRRMNDERIIADAIGHPVSDVYSLLRTQVLQRMRTNNMTTLAVTSPESGAGVTTTSANLALAIALDVNQTVLLVDLNLRDPGLHRKFHVTPQAGVDDYLHGDVELRDCLISPGVPRLVVLPARTSNSEAAEVLSSPRMAALARELRGRYPDRIIVYDMPPLIPSGDTLGFLPNVEAVLLVARSGRTTKAEIEKSANLLGTKPIVGTLLNAH